RVHVRAPIPGTGSTSDVGTGIGIRPGTSGRSGSSPRARAIVACVARGAGDARRVGGASRRVVTASGRARREGTTKDQERSTPGEQGHRLELGAANVVAVGPTKERAADVRPPFGGVEPRPSPRSGDGELDSPLRAGNHGRNELHVAQVVVAGRR